MKKFYNNVSGRILLESQIDQALGYAVSSDISTLNKLNYFVLEDNALIPSDCDFCEIDHTSLTFEFVEETNSYRQTATEIHKDLDSLKNKFTLALYKSLNDKLSTYELFDPVGIRSIHLLNDFDEPYFNNRKAQLHSILDEYKSFIDDVRSASSIESLKEVIQDIRSKGVLS